mmetsp:Transcript_41288/g.62868  ORF Transcript_41288/g.62868 Transcript_41288/m.62868 type:complete len:89 (-) Transcript_41288:748-1014(-)
MEKLTSGSGLGLYLSLQLAEYFGGSIEIDSILNKGTSVKISLMAEVFNQSIISNTSSVFSTTHKHQSFIPFANSSLNYDPGEQARRKT